MSLADFSQDAHDNARLFVYVTPLGETSGALYAAVIETLQNFPPFHPRGVKDAFLSLRFLNRLPRWARDGQPWKEFQPFKRVLGVLAVTQCQDNDDLDEAEEGFRRLCRDYTVCESRCVVYGPKTGLEEGISTRKDFNLVEFDNQYSFSKPDVAINSPALTSLVKALGESLYHKVQGYIGDLKKELEAGGKLRQLRSPMDGREAVNEEETRLNRNQLSGRFHKHIADLHLLCGQLQLACTHFANAISLLSRDPLWMGSANEGLGATFIMWSRHNELNGQKTPPLSVQPNVLGGIFKVPILITGSRLLLKSNTLERKKSGGQNEVGGGGAGEERGAMSNGRASIYKHHRGPSTDVHNDTLDSIEDDGLDMGDASVLDASEDGSIEPDGTDGPEGDDEDLEITARKLLQKDLVVDKFTRAELHYKKAGASGGVPRIELLFKFARYLVSQERYKPATEVLQNIFWTVGYIDEHDKTTLLESIANVFTSMGYHRKAGLFMHWAALNADRVATSVEDCYTTHSILSKCLSGYNLSLSQTTVPETTTSAPTGWPLLQAVVMKDLVNLTYKTDQTGLYIQYGCFLLQRLHPYLDGSDISDVVEILERILKSQTWSNDYSSTDQGEAESLERRLTRNLSADVLTAPVPLTQFPIVGSFRPKLFPLHIRPYRTTGSITKGPFIVSQLKGKKPQRPEVLWVINEPAEIAMDVTNPLNFELRVEKMKLLWEGVSISACPSSLSLPSKDKQDFTLTALPQEVGELELIGYEHTVFGVHSKCSIKVEGNPVIRVIPMLPQLRIRILPVFHAPRSSGEGSGVESSFFKHGEGHRSSIGPRVELDMLDGEKCKVEFKLECQKGASIESLSITVENSTETHKPEEFCHITCPTIDVIENLLPILKKQQRNFFVDIKAFFPAYYRVKNELMSTALSGEYLVEESIVMSQKPSIKKRGSPFRSPATQRHQESLARGSPPPHTRHFVASSNTVSIMDSLNIDPPKSSSPHVSPFKKGYKRAGSTKARYKDLNAYEEELDFGDKRASIRSDPGDRKREGSGLFNRSPKGSHTSTPVRKSLPHRVGSSFEDSDSSPSRSGKEGSVFSFNEGSNSPGGSSGSPKSPVRVRKVVGITKNEISQPSDVKHYIPTIPDDVVIKNHFTVKYSGGEGEKAGYHRCMESSIRLKVRPSLYFSEFRVSSSEGERGFFYFSFYIHNKSGCMLTVNCSYKGKHSTQPSKVTLRSRQKHRIGLNLRRFHIPKIPVLFISAEAASNATKQYSDHVAEQVKIEWELEGAKKCGVSSLKGMRLESSVLHHMQPDPLLIDVTVNGKSISMDSEDHCIGVPVNISLTISNNAGCTIPSSWLLVNVSEFKHGVICSDLTGRMAQSGNLIQKLPQLKEQETYTHTVTLVFFYRGDYPVEFIAYVPTKKDFYQEETDLDTLSSMNLCRSEGPKISPVKIYSRPLKSKLQPTSVEESREPCTHQDRLISISELTELTHRSDSTKQNRHFSQDQSPFTRKRSSTSNTPTTMKSRLSRLCKQPIPGPKLTLRIVESQSPPQPHSQTRLMSEQV